MSAYFLGVDGGQSSTTALIGDETGQVIGFGHSGPCNHVEGPDGRAKFINAIEGCVGEAGRNAALDTSAIRFDSACLGFSGGPADKEAILRELLVTGRMLVTHDALIALSGATGGAPGLIVIAGTGSIAFGRSASGETARAGGWGYVFGDAGGGFDLARQALRAALRQEEGWGPPTLLRDLLLQATDAANANDLLHRFYTVDFPRPRVAALSKLVDQAAHRGDMVAQQILANAAEDLAILAHAVRNQLFQAGAQVRAAYIGGVFRSALLLQHFRGLLEPTDGLHLSQPEFGPAAGALIEAYRLAGLHPTITNIPETEK